MALITDRGINTTADLHSYESSILEVAGSEGIDLNAKLVLAQRELEIQISMWLARESSDVSIKIENVVVTEPLRQWHALQTLSIVYRDAFHHQLNDRFQGKWTEYNRLSASASSYLFESGLGIVKAPLPRADRPDVGLSPGALPAATYYTCVAWCNEVGGEGTLSETATLAAPDGSLIWVRPVKAPQGASGWNVYAGLSEQELTRQNTTVIAIDSTWTLDPSGLVTGQTPSFGQLPDFYVKSQHVLPRG